MILLALTLQDAVPTIIPRTLQSETGYGYLLACTVANSDLKVKRVESAQTGGRAYVAPDREGKPRVCRTRAELLVIKDETGQLLGMSVSKPLIDRPSYEKRPCPSKLAAQKAARRSGYRK